jgi:LCP family protein required for cell wall assembly
MGAHDRVKARLQKRKSKSSENWMLVAIATSLLGFTLVIVVALVFVLRMNNNDGENGAEAQASSASEEPTSIYNNPENFFEPTPSGEAVAVTGDDTFKAGDEGESESGLDTDSDEPIRGALEGGNSMVINPWDGKERFTVLVMGMDNRPDQGDTYCRTDSMMIISIDPDTKRIGILSIPRDTYVQIPNNHGINRINAACTIGKLDPNTTGPRLAMQTVQYNFGIRIHDYVLVDFQAFIKIIDLIGGIDVNVAREIDDPTYPSMNYGYDHFYISAGDHHLDGETALKYARSRHTSDDIDRAKRQQQILFAVRDKILDVGMMDELLVQAPVLWAELEGGIDTGLEIDQIMQLAAYAQDIPADNIKSAVVDWSYLIGYRTEGGASVLVPNRRKLGPLMLEVFGEGYNQ